MSSSLTVLCPNGRRQTVKANFNTKILDILDEVCKKQGYNTNDYDLIYQRKNLDTSLTYRLSGLPNNAQLDLKKLENGPRQYQDVTIALQLDDGSRLPQQQTFRPDTTTIFDVIDYFYKNNPASFKKEIFDENENYRLSLFPSVSYLNDQIIGLFQMKNTTLKYFGLTSGRSILRFHYKQMAKEDFDKLNIEFKNKLEKQSKLIQVFESKKKDLEFVQQQMNEVETRDNKSVEKRNSSEPPVEKKLKYNTSDVDKKCVKSEPESLIHQESSMSTLINSEPTNQFINFKFPEETKGQQLNDLNELAEIEKISKEPCDRKAVFFNLEESLETKNSDMEELSDEFFDVTVQDLRYMLNDLQKRQTEDNPLMTRQMREIEQDRKAMKYSQIVVRIAFPNSRLVLQGLFRPKEKLSALYDFVRKFIHSTDPQDVDFYLFSSPPKQILNQMKMTLFELKLCPASLIYFKNKSNQMPDFNEFDSLIKTSREANEIVHKEVHQTMRLDIDNHEGMTWLKQEQSLVKNILSKTTSKNENSTYIDYESSTSKSTSSDDPVKKKLERFLGAKK